MLYIQYINFGSDVPGSCYVSARTLVMVEYTGFNNALRCFDLETTDLLLTDRQQSACVTPRPISTEINNHVILISHSDERTAVEVLLEVREGGTGRSRK